MIRKYFLNIKNEFYFLFTSVDNIIESSASLLSFKSGLSFSSSFENSVLFNADVMLLLLFALLLLSVLDVDVDDVKVVFGDSFLVLVVVVVVAAFLISKLFLLSSIV